jgi:NitT/TauT family transport system substrate-binding protein
MLRLFAAALAAILAAGAARAADHIEVGVVAAMGRAPEFIARDKGYFKALWIDPDDVVRPTPMLISGTLVNTDWAARNPDAMKRYFAAIAHGIRDYCTAYHGGANRREIIDILTRNTAIKDADFLDKSVWLSRQASGEVPIDSLMDIEDVFFREGLIKQKFAADELVDMTWIRAADAALGAFAPPPGSAKKGCR